MGSHGPRERALAQWVQPQRNETSSSPSQHHPNAPLAALIQAHTHRHWLPASSRVRSQPATGFGDDRDRGVVGHRVSTHFRASSRLAARRCCTRPRAQKHIMGKEENRRPARTHTPPWSEAPNTDARTHVWYHHHPIQSIPLPVSERSMPVN